MSPRPTFPGQTPREGAPRSAAIGSEERATLLELMRETRGGLALGPEGLVCVLHRDAHAALLEGGRRSDRYALAVAALVLAPALVGELAEEVCGSPLRGHALESIARCRRLAPTYAALEAAEAEARARRARERAARVTSRPASQRGAYWHRYRTLRADPAARAQLGHELGGRVSGESVRGVACPACGRPSLWWWVEPRRATRARCSHSSCAVSMPLHELGAE